MNGQSTTVIWDRVVITLSISDNRIDVNATADIVKTGFYEYDSTPFTGTITFNDTTTKNTVGRYGYKVSSISDPVYGLTVFTTNEVYCIFDRININTFTVTDNRINVGDTASFTVSGIYEYDYTSWLGTYTLNDTVTKIVVGRYGYRISSVTDELYGLTAFQQTAPNLYVIFDKVSISLSISKSRVNVGEAAPITINAIYVYDSSSFDGDVTLNATTTKNAVGKYGFTVLSISGGTHGITVFESNSVSCIFDRVNINTFTVLDNRINVGDTAVFTVKGAYEYDSAPWVGSYILNDTATKSTVGKYGYKIASIPDSNYGLTAFRQTALDVYVIFDRINVVIYGSDDARRDVNTEATFYLTLQYEYDSSSVVDGIAYLNGSLPLTWSSANARWEYKTTKSSIQKLTVYLASVSENAYGITALNPSASSKTISVIWDRIRITDGGTTKETLTLGETATIWFKATYEYDETTFTSANGTLYLNGTQMTWSTTNTRWEYTYTATTTGTATFTVSAVSDSSQGLTTINDVVGTQTITIWSMPFSIISNSTITELAFNSTTKTITFTANGPDGTIGYVNITIAKTLIADIDELKIYLDGKQIEYDATSTEYAWLIHFNYTHSTHKVLITFGSTQTSTPYADTSRTKAIFSGILVILIAAILLFYGKSRRR
jgi:hypothetical protein